MEGGGESQLRFHFPILPLERCLLRMVQSWLGDCWMCFVRSACLTSIEGDEAGFLAASWPQEEWSTPGIRGWRSALVWRNHAHELRLTVSIAMLPLCLSCKLRGRRRPRLTVRPSWGSAEEHIHQSDQGERNDIKQCGRKPL